LADSEALPKGQSYGDKARQQQFVQATAPPKGQPTLLPESDPTNEVEGIGDLNEFLFAPSERPGEPLNTPAGGISVQPPLDPGPDFFKLAQDPNLSAEVRGMMRGGLIAQILGG
jgi:hypothetical protein